MQLYIATQLDSWLAIWISYISYSYYIALYRAMHFISLNTKLQLAYT